MKVLKLTILLILSLSIPIKSFDINCKNKDFMLKNTLSLGVIDNGQIVQYTLDHQWVIYPKQSNFGLILANGSLIKMSFSFDDYYRIKEIKNHSILLKEVSLSMQIINHNQTNIVLHRINSNRHTFMLKPWADFGGFASNESSLNFNIDKIIPIWTTVPDSNFYRENNIALLHFLIDLNSFNVLLFNDYVFKDRNYLVTCLNQNSLKFIIGDYHCSNTDAVNFFNKIRFIFTFNDLVYLISIIDGKAYYFKKEYFLTQNNEFTLNEIELDSLFQCSNQIISIKNSSETINWPLVIVLILTIIFACLFFCKDRLTIKNNHSIISKSILSTKSTDTFDDKNKDRIDSIQKVKTDNVTGLNNSKSDGQLKSDQSMIVVKYKSIMEKKISNNSANKSTNLHQIIKQSTDQINNKELMNTSIDTNKELSNELRQNMINVNESKSKKKKKLYVMLSSSKTYDQLKGSKLMTNVSRIGRIPENNQTILLLDKYKRHIKFNNSKI